MRDAFALLVPLLIVVDATCATPSLAADRVLIAPVQAGALAGPDLAAEAGSFNQMAVLLEEAVRAGTMHKAPDLDLLVMSHETLVGKLNDLHSNGRDLELGLPCRSLRCDAALARALGTQFAVSTQLTKSRGQYVAVLTLVTDSFTVIGTSRASATTFVALLKEATTNAERLVVGVAGPQARAGREVVAGGLVESPASLGKLRGPDTAAVPVGLATDRKPFVSERIVKSVSAVERRVEHGHLIVEASVAAASINVGVTRARRCFADTVVTETVEQYVENKWAGPTAVGLIAIGILSAGSGVVAAVLAPNQPSSDDCIGDCGSGLSSEASYGVVAVGGLVGAAATGTGVALAVFASESVMGDVERKSVANTVAVPCATEPVRGADVRLMLANGRGVSRHTGANGTVMFALGDKLALPADGSPWGRVEVTVEAETPATMAVMPEADAFVPNLLATSDIAALERFRARFPGNPAWARLEDHYSDLVAAKALADRERVRGELSAALARGDLLGAAAHLRQAEQLGVDVADERRELAAAAANDIGARLKSASVLIRAGKLAEADVGIVDAHSTATTLGMDTPAVLAAVARERAALKAAGRRHLARATALAKAGKLDAAIDEAFTAHAAGVEMTEEYKKAFASAKERAEREARWHLRERADAGAQEARRSGAHNEPLQDAALRGGCRQARLWINILGRLSENEYEFVEENPYPPYGPVSSQHAILKTSGGAWTTGRYVVCVKNIDDEWRMVRLSNGFTERWQVIYEDGR